MVSFEMNDRKKIGLGLTGFGVLFSILGIIFFFDKGLLAMGNILFVSGISLTIGLKSSMQFFTRRKNYKGTISFGAGFLLVLIGWAVTGMILEAYGFVVLFSGFWPTLAVLVQRIPVLGWLFQQPFVTSDEIRVQKSVWIEAAKHELRTRGKKRRFSSSIPAASLSPCSKASLHSALPSCASARIPSLRFLVPSSPSRHKSSVTTKFMRLYTGLGPVIQFPCRGRSGRRRIRRGRHPPIPASNSVRPIIQAELSECSTGSETLSSAAVL